LEFWEKPLGDLDRAEWEALCDGCGKCCLHKVEDEDTGRIYPTNVACRLLDRNTAQCSNYRNRRAFVPDCLRLTAAALDRITWLPGSCAYKLRAEGKPLPAWHYLISGDRQAVHAAGQSVRGWTVAEVEAGDLENHIVDREI
jgi:uncharacterized cysteine cluster protein YcgN (CxxCxxCC family)